jgi:hypothetical protein
MCNSYDTTRLTDIVIIMESMFGVQQLNKASQLTLSWLSVSRSVPCVLATLPEHVAVALPAATLPWSYEFHLNRITCR